VHKKGLVKTIGFNDPRYIGEPINAVKIFNEKEADEILIFDIDASSRKIEPDYQLIANIAAECRMPLCYGGGIKTVEQAKKIINLGVEKVAISSAAVLNPALIAQISNEIGSQSTAVVLDVKKRKFTYGYDVLICNGLKNTGRDVLELAIETERLGAGELIINSIDKDGDMSGYDIDLAQRVRSAINIPISFLGGAGNLGHIEELISACGVIGASAGSLFLYKGAYKAVLINYPSFLQRSEFLGRTLSK
jgi:cyclase